MPVKEESPGADVFLDGGNDRFGSHCETPYWCVFPRRQRSNLSRGLRNILHSSPSVETSVLWFAKPNSYVESVLSDLWFDARNKGTIITTQSTTDLGYNESTVDYIFNSPFGGNLMYSELNVVWESWLRIFTNNAEEAIENSVQRKTVFSYQQLMARCFASYYKLLKPGRWMTVEFHN